MFVIQQSSNLKWTVRVSWSKNASLPIIAANYLTDKKIKLHNLPDILDVHNLQEVAEDAIKKSKGKAFFDLTSDKCLKIRVSILMIPYGLLKYKKVKFIGTGGCNLGKRSLDAFDDALTQCGIKITQKGTIKTYEQVEKPSQDIIQKEFSVTTTEAVLTYLAFLPGRHSTPYTIHNAAIEPHVLDLVAFLKNMWAKIEINYDHSIVIYPQTIKVNKKEFTIIWDMLEAGLYLAIWAVAPKSNITVTGVDIKELLSTFTFARSIGIDYKILDHQSFQVTAKNLGKYKASQIKTMIFPWFPTDLQSVMAVVLTQSEWVGKIFERLFEGRFAYLTELEKLGAKCEILNPHQAVIIGPTKLKGNIVNSTDIRGWGALLVAGIISSWTTTIYNESIILRWYDNIIEKLQSIGVKITEENGKK